jgi:prepilin-type N-terminal cleavage/methylation domain-containing protein
MRAQFNSAGGTQRGFTLIELSVVMIIVAFLIGGLIYTLAAQVEQRNFEETRRRIEQARELILAFAITKGRLPCPARSVATASPATVAGDEVLTTTGTVGCIGDTITDFYGGTNGGVTLGLLPARSIGYQQVDSSGFAVDAWGNRLRYAVANLITNCSGSSTLPHFVNAANLKANGISCQPNDLLVCKSSTGITTTDCGTVGGIGANQIMTQSLVVAIIYSTGKNGAGAAGGADEAANLNGDRVFVYHTPAPSTAANGEFDDQFTWITHGELYGRMIAAGILP